VTLCLVTDRQRSAGSLPALLAQIRAGIEAGVDLVQIRERDLDAAALSSLVAAVVDLTRGSTSRVVVNDRLDVALACGADGVHLRGDSVPIAAARRLAPPPFLVGRSVHSADEVVSAAVNAAGADYLIAGTVFPTASKPGVTTWLGLEGLRAVVRATTVPVLAIGGVTLERLVEVASTGAAGIAAIGLFESPRLVELVAQIRHRFDTAASSASRRDSPNPESRIPNHVRPLV
jgi:thiamine-phosphate diphosphorylase